MADIGRVLREYLETVKDDIISEIRSQNRVASGRAVRTLRVVQNQSLEAQLRGEGYIEFLQTGIGSKPARVSPAFTKRIAEWMVQKGISPKHGSIRRSAGAIARDIVYRGTAIRRGQRGIDIDQILRDNLTPALQDYADEILTTFDKQLKIGR